MAWLALSAGAAFAAQGGGAPSDAEPSVPGWLTDFEDAARQSRIRNEPVLAVSSMARCPYCRMFAQTLSAPEVREKLARFVLFRLDLDHDWETARRLGVSVAPAALMIAPNGVTAARADGCLPPAAFLEWLAGARKAASQSDPAQLAARPPAELLELLGARDPVVREAATQALAAQPAAAPTIVEALAGESLARRLGVLELLRLWGAPAADLDPWKPETVPPALENLRAWAKDSQKWQQRPKPLAEELDRDLALWTDGEEGPESRAAYERLAQLGPELLPRVRALMPSAWDRRGERLAALRYRLLMPAAQALRLPQAPFQMAAREAPTRLAALSALARAAGPGLDGFFLEAFGDSDPKVREAALRGLRKTGAQIAKEHVLRLLADPSPDVRATVLKGLVESPLPDVTEELAAYVLAEPDEDLVVHGTQALRCARNSDKAFEALLKLTEHESWRVRAAAVESFGNVSTSGRELNKLPKGKNEAILQMLKRALRDEDVFVISKAIDVMGDLPDLNLGECVGDLADAARAHSDVTLQALEAMAGNPSMHAKATGTIKELSRHEDPQIRAAAVRALVAARSSVDVDEVLKALEDPAESVRVAAGEAVWNWAENAESVDGVRRLRVESGQRERLTDALRKAAASESLPQRFSALLALGALGDLDFAFAGMQEVLSKDASYAPKAAALVSLLPWSKRKEAFGVLRQFPLNDQTWASLFVAVCQHAPASAESFLWEIYEEDPHVLGSPSRALDAILGYYGLNVYSLSADVVMRSEASGGQKTAHLADKAREQLKSANGRRAAMGLILLSRARPADGEAEAKKILEAPAEAGVPEELRRAACEVLLCIGCPTQESVVMSTLGSTDEGLRTTAFGSLLRTYTPLRFPVAVHVGEEAVWVQFLGSSQLARQLAATTSGGANREWKAPALPAGLTAEAVRPFLSASDPQISAGAAYLLVLLKDSSALPTLVEAWRAEKDSSELQMALAQAVAASDNDDAVELVREVYQSLETTRKEYVGPQLYWGIRRMDGPKAKQLRKEMRDELGRRLFD